jgi:WD40 repeat protein
MDGDTKIVNAGHWPRIWTAQGQLVGRLTEDREEQTFRPIAVDAPSHRILMGSQDGRVYAWNLKHFRLAKRSPQQPDYVDTIALLPAINAIAYCGYGKRLRLWSADLPSRELALDVSPWSNLAALADGASILFGTAEGEVELWDLRSPPHLVKAMRLFR